ncbi:MAG TPA: hypothetical protein VIU46_10470 [Gallionellaceae bacterium]
MFTDRVIPLLAGMFAFAGIAAVVPACASDASEDARQEYALEKQAGTAVAATSDAGDAELHCAYLPAAAKPGEKTFRFEDGNKAEFSASRIQFVTADGSKTQIEDGAEVARKNWWCQADGIVLFRSVKSAGGKLGAVKVEWFDSRGARISVMRVKVPGENGDWSYERSRVVDECLGMTFRVQEGKNAKPARFVEYKLCPSGI